MRKTHLFICLLLLFSCFPAMAQNINVSGTVKDASTSEPLIGVSILVKGTTVGTVTDFDGNYSLQAPANGALVFSYIGFMPQEIAVKNKKNINVAMVSDTKNLDEVIVVGVSMKKSDLTGAVGSVSQKVLEEKPVTNINQALQGRVAGVLINNAARPDQDGSIKIRGINTINGATDPIYVVDGLVMDNWGGGFNSINLNDVASVEVLKDASATALYGSRAANGVVLITTKKGKKGEGKVTYDGWLGTRSYAKMPEQMSGKQLLELRSEAAINAYTVRHPGYTDADLADFVAARVMTPYVDGQAGSGFVYAPYELEAYADPNFQDYNWLDEVTQPATDQNHNVSFSGANNDGSYYLSFGYADSKGLVKKLSDKKYSGRINADYNIKKWLKVGTNTEFVRQNSEIFDDDGVYSNARGASPFLQPSDVLTLNWGGVYDQNYFNPINTLRIDNDRVRNRLISSSFINVSPYKGFNIRSTFAINYFEQATFRYVPNDIQQAIRYAHTGEATHTRDQRTSWQWDNTISYDNTFGKHRFNALLGQSISKIDHNYTQARGTGFADNLFDYYNLGASNHITNRQVSSGFDGSALSGFIARANWSYDDKYYLTATARLDGSSKFAPGYRWGVFPSFSAAWNLLQEDFMKDLTFFDQLKLRLGYGSVGNQDITDYAFLNLNYASVIKDETSYLNVDRVGTQDISWEKQQQYNIGVDMVFWNNRVRFSADAFHILNNDLLMTVDYFESTGYKKRVVNVGAIQNQGMEFSADVNAIKTKDFQWNVSANISFDRNKVTRLDAKKQAVYNYDGDRNLQKEGNLFIGQPRNTIFIWRTGGIAQEGDMEMLNQIDWAGKQVHPGDLYPLAGDDNKLDNLEDRVIVGSPDPKFYGGFATDLNYKGIGLNAVFNYSYGAKKLSYIYESMTGSNGKSIASIDLLDRWTPENTDAKYPRVYMNDPADGTTTAINVFSASQMDRSVQDASYLRLSTLTLSYTLPTSITNIVKLSNLRVYATASNVFVLTPYKGFDPETGDWYPPTRQFVAGINVSF